MSNEELTLPSEEQTSLNPEKQNLLASENFGNELLMKNIFNVLPAGIIYLDHEYYVQYINKLGCQVINVDENDYILGKIFFELKTTIQLPNLKIAFQKIKSSNQPITLWGYPVPKRLNSDDGEASFSSGDKTQGDLSKYSYWDLTLYPLVNVNKNNVGVLLFAIEVTDRVRLERGMQDSINNVKQTAHKLESLIHQMSDGVIVCDADANVVTINDAAITMLGAATSAVAVSKPETTPLLWRTDQQPFPANEYPWRTACLYGQTSINVEIMINKHLHEQTIISVNAAPLKDDNGKLSGSISVLRDVTENRRLIDELSTANRRLEEYNRLKAEFVANMSHELRTPLNAILGFAQILQIKSPTEPLVGSQNSSVERILRNGRHLLRLIDDVLDLSKIEAGRINFHPDHFDLVKLVEGAFSELESLAHNKKLAYKLSVTGNFPLAYLDSVRVKQIITNLLSNAIKFTASGSVTAELKLIDNEKWMLAMHDTGAGIKPEALKLIFERFRQIDGTTTRTVGGVGLGLSIAQQMAYMLGGQILVESEEGVGSTFTLILPLRMPNELRFEVIHAENSEKSEFSRLSKNADDKDTHPLILAIDDNADSRSLLTETLTRAGYRVETAIDGATGLRLAKELLPTAVVLDIMMPQVDGWQVLQTMKGDAHTSGIPVIVCSIVDNRPLGYQLGASDYLVKPVEPHQLIETLRTVATHSATDDHANNYILVVDDEYGVREMLVAALKQEGYQVRSAASGEIAFNIAVQKTPSVVLCDLIMFGGMSGFELIARLRTNPSTAKTPIIVITGREVTPEDRRLMSGQIADVIRKGDLLMPNVEVRLREVLDDLGIIP